MTHLNQDTITERSTKS